MCGTLPCNHTIYSSVVWKNVVDLKIASGEP